MIRIRESFAAKLLASLVGTVGVLLVVTFLVVQTETQRQVNAVSAEAVEVAEESFRGQEEFQRREVDRIADRLAGGVRTRRALDEAIATGDRSYLGGHVSYEVDLADIPDIVVAFTDPRGRPVLTVHNDVAMEEADPMGIVGVAEALMDSDAFEMRSYRLLEGVLFGIRTRVIEEGGRAIGTMSLGLPMTDDDITEVGDVVRVEVCIVIADACVAGTPRGRAALSAALVSVAGATEVITADADGEPWSVRARPLLEEAPDQGWRVVAVPLAPVFAPFDRIRRALMLSGGAALLLAVLIGTALSRGLSRPIRDLVSATHRVAEGDFETEVAVTSHDEVGTLAEAFNDMTHGLLLKEQYRSVLNKVVSEDVAKELMEGGVELGGENRRVTVLFADIRGFTPLTDGMEPQEVIGFLNECMQRLSDAVEVEGGVVDKYVGDELMAVFGVPVSEGDDALHALRAAVRMKRAMADWNRSRTERGLLPVDLGVGINSGTAVAGNMGSRNRLNYTVLGDMVNMGARLCSGASAGEILVTQATLDEAGGDVRYESKGEQAFKGFATEVEVFNVLDTQGLLEGEADVEAESPPKPAGTARPPGIAGVLLACTLALPCAAAAQEDALPTLADAGLGYISESGFFQLGLSGNLDIEGFRFADHKAGLAWVDAPGTYLVAHRLRLFTDVFVGERLYGLVELRSDRGPTPNDGELEGRVEQAYLRVSNLSGSLSLQAGRFASPFGSYAARHLTPTDPFVRPPLPYDFQTIQSPSIAPTCAPGFLEWKSNPHIFRHGGAPPVWEVPYQWGAMIAGASGRLSYRLAAMNSAPSSAPDAWAWDSERFDDPSWVMGLGFTLSPELRVGASFNRGPWLEEITRGDTDVDPYRSNYVQEMISGDVTYARGSAMVRAEVIHDRWEVPNVADDPVDIGYSIEAQSDLAAGLFAAVRYGGLDFSFVDDGLGAASSRSEGGDTWDHDVRRYELSLGYRVVQNAGVLLSWFKQSQVEGDSDTNLTAVRLWWAF